MRSFITLRCTVFCCAVQRFTISHFLELYSLYSLPRCTSGVGYSPGRAQLSLGRHCDDVGIILHELGHVIGFWHEQNRPDRDHFVRIIWNNIRRSKAFKFCFLLIPTSCLVLCCQTSRGDGGWGVGGGVGSSNVSRLPVKHFSDL